MLEPYRDPALLTLAFWILSITVALGTLLAIDFLCSGKLSRWIAGAAHGVLGASGLVTLALASAHIRNVGAQGDLSSFASAALAIGLLALVLGFAIVLLKRRPHRSIGLVIGAHATCAIAAYVILLAYVSLT